MHEQPQTTAKKKSIVGHKRFWLIVFVLIISPFVGRLLFTSGVASRTLARAGALERTATGALEKPAAAIMKIPTAITGAPGDQQVSLSWQPAIGASSYRIEQTDLVTGQAHILPTIVAATSFSPGGLLVGHWYRFRVIPVNGEIEGSPSAPIEIRTKGFSGSYSNYGDSYSAGDGAPPYTGAKMCYRSMNSYPYLLGNGVPAPMLIACAGAVADSIDKTVQHPWLPGTQLSQLLSGPHGDTLITITIGGNDVGFASELKNCITSTHSCVSRRDIIAQRIINLQARLLQVYQDLRQAAPGADIIIVGYPLLVAAPQTADCHNPLIHIGLSGSEMQMIRDLAAQLDNVISQTATQAGVVAATQQVEQEFAGHEACAGHEGDEWINEVAGLNDVLRDTFHPNSLGYQAMARAVDSSRNALYQVGMVRQ